jgi:general transcription factor 3C polypeptide 3 (transcription factor C subunit 4)
MVPALNGHKDFDVMDESNASHRNDDETEMSYPDPSRVVQTPYPTLSTSHTQDEASRAEHISYQSGTENGLHPALHDESNGQSHQGEAAGSIAEQARSFAQEFYDQVGPPGGDGLEEDQSDWIPNDTQAETDVETEFEDTTDIGNVDIGDILDGGTSILGTSGSTTKSKTKSKGQTKARKRGWRQFLKGTEFENLGKAKRDPPPPKRPVPRRNRNYVDPGRDFKEMLSKASQEFMADNLDAAADFARGAVEANPEIFAAHSLLSEILRKQGKNEDSIRVLTWGAHVAKQPTVWLNILERILELLEDSPSEALIKEALDCAKEGLRLKAAASPDLQYMFQRHRFQLYKQLGDTTATRKTCKYIIKRWPKDIQMCREFAELCPSWNDTTELKFAKKLYDDALASLDDPSQLEPEDDPWRHVIAYLEVVTLLDEPANAIAAGKRLSRWVLGRKAESFWDTWNDDDREFDVDDERRLEVPGFESSGTPEDRAKYGESLPIEIRVKLGRLRAKMGASHLNEASKHFEHLAAFEDSIEYYYDLYLQAASSLNAAGLLQDAARLYDTLRDVPDVINEPTWMAMGMCYEGLRQKEDAIECFEEVLNLDGESYSWASARLAKIYEEAGDSEKARSLCEEVIKLGRRDLLRNAKVKDIPILLPSSRTEPTDSEAAPTEALSTIPIEPSHAAVEGTFGEFQLEPPLEPPLEPEAGPARPPKKTRKRIAEDRASGTDTPAVKRSRKPRSNVIRRPTMGAERQLRQFEDARSRIHANIGVVHMHWSAMESAEDEEAINLWVEAASNLLEEFLATRVFFPDNSKNMQVKVSAHEERIFTRIEAGVPNPDAPTAFQDITFYEWHHILADLALYHAKRGEQEKCYKIVQGVLLTANVFWQDPEIERISISVALCCALIFNDGQYAVELGRKIIGMGDSRSTTAFQLFAATNRFIYGSNWFQAGPSQKFMHRILKTADFLAMPSDLREQYDFAIQKNSLNQRLAKLSDETHEVNANALMIYGHMVAVANHSYTSLPYYFRTLAMYPDDICVNLSIATMWVQNSMKRQTENRHFGIMQGLAFLYRYYELRTASGRACDLQEAEYNVARMWHNLGLLHIAMPAYEKVLDLSVQVQAEWLAGRSQRGESTAFDEAEDFAKEAAFALQSIYAVDGNDEAARAITEEWLVI